MSLIGADTLSQEGFIVCCGYDWDKIRCSKDWAPVQPGLLPPDQIGRFPWLGVIQHDFYSADTMRYSITGAVLIHPEFALAPAEDMAKIDKDILSNTTHFIVWHSADLRYSIGVEDYIMHPEYEDRRTYATTALVELMIVESNQVGHPAPVLPICLPAKNHPSFDKIYVVKMTTGDDGQILKEIFSMIAIDNKDCDMFYEKAELDFKMMLPSQPICAATLEQQPACIWDGGAVLVTREPDSYWTLVRTSTLGFGVRGPGCGAPARFVDVQSQLLWIDPQIYCQLDLEETVPEGVVPKDQMGRFPWIGIIQHDFYIAETMRYAITTGVLIHPAYALAPAEDMAKINRQTITNTTRFIVWFSDTVRHTMGVEDYVMHHEYELEKTYASIALVEIIPHGATTRGHPSVIYPICLPYKGSGTFDKLYVVRMTDATGELMKEVTKVDYVEKEDCDRFYEKAELNYELMMPSESICATAQAQQPACVWDGGAVLVSRRADSWILLGFGIRGPGCGAPARFVSVFSHIEWIDIQITAIPAERAGEDTGYILRSVSPVETIMYAPGEHAKTSEGQCKSSKTTGVIYRDMSEVFLTNNYGRGYFFVTDQADFSCLVVSLHCNQRSNAAMWVEHNCYRDVSGTHRGQDKRRSQTPHFFNCSLQCYKYFKSTAFIEFRFTFSYLAKIEIKVYGSRVEEPSPPLDPWAGEMTTLTWWPTDGERHGMRWGLFVPVDAWWFKM
ncbi:uncharacterized protein LOC134654380 [Cydia amplana]|uniref:uncharacterized protein LOC134654380 n=1 Tax=Cydia amplana TaxID=1869771 RepID=UPI002FE55EFA